MITGGGQENDCRSGRGSDQEDCGKLIIARL